MESGIVLLGDKIVLKSCTNKLWHEFYKNYILDPMMDISPYYYDFEYIESAYNSKTTDPTRKYFMILYNGNVIGQIYFKHIDIVKMSSEIGIALINDSVKGKGFGTDAIKVFVNYAFNTLNFKSIIADTVLRNTRSQHVLEKIGFIYTHENSEFKYYLLEKKL